MLNASALYRTAQTRRSGQQQSFAGALVTDDDMLAVVVHLCDQN
ncbi:hypothetical protein [Streptomyces sp. MI02-7b]|nr:hypothetical protein [Streptomyces sp. MI02-7b]MDX3076975.1 hypothetical protein [Streptomyces sp. MI02-7b]